MVNVGVKVSIYKPRFMHPSLLIFGYVLIGSDSVYRVVLCFSQNP
jgi:hypothetical protein